MAEFSSIASFISLVTNYVGHPNRGTRMHTTKAISIISLVLAIGHSTVAFAYDPTDCLNEVAELDPKINIGSATELCSGAWTPEPAKCYGLASKVDEGIIRGIAVELCVGSVNSEKTIACYIKAGKERRLNRGLSTTLCSARKNKN
jgi:hypothetical protein